DGADVRCARRRRRPVRRDVALVALLVLGAAGAAWFATSHDEDVPPPRHADPRPHAEPTPRPPRRRETTEAPAAPAEPAPVPAPPPAAAPAPPPEPRFLGGRTAKEVVAPFADVARRSGRERFRDDMVPGGPLTQLCDVVDEDYDRAVESFTRG